ncbi:MAG: hypothetical protein F4X02_05910 [Chloroflexi bacterium]|nr:hypothetical protein [Chloroflexota bacterium]
MRIAILLLVIQFTLSSLAQETGSADEPAPGTVASLTLESPFLQDDLELLVGNVQRPNGFVWHEGSLYTICNGDWTIYKIDDRTGDTITFVFGTRDGNTLILEDTAAGFDIWVPDPESGTLWKVDHRRAAPAPITTELEAPWGITRLDSSQFLITDTRVNAIAAVSVDGQRREVHGELRAPTGIVKDGRHVYFANGGSARRGIEYFTVDDVGVYSSVKPLVSGLQNTTNLALGSDGKLYFAYALGTRGVIGRIDPTICHDSGCSGDDVELVVFSDIPAPLAITLSDDLRLFLHSRFRPEIYWLQLPLEST